MLAWIPTDITRGIRIAGWTNLVVNILIVVSGGAVRLTASGLGCPTWPTCTADSLITTPEMGIHGVIEFTNRLLTFVLVLVALSAFILVVRLRKIRPALFWIALAVGLGIPAQAIIGGISVLVQLNPYVVGLHFVVSAAIVALCSIFVVLLYPGTAEGRPSRSAVWVAVAMTCQQFITVLLGVLTTGSGPHAGDALAPRNGLSSELLQHLHSYPAYAGLALAVLLAIYAGVKRRSFLLRLTLVLCGVNALQVGVGITQSRLGLPVGLVAGHMFLACCVVALTVAVIGSFRSRA